jgi:hypothetical protein
VTITVRVTHPDEGVSIRFGDRWHPGPSGRFTVERGDRPVTFRVRAPGYRERRVERVPDRDREVEIVLQKQRVRPHQRHRRAVRRSSRRQRRRRGRKRRAKNRDGLLRFEDLGGGR